MRFYLLEDVRNPRYSGGHTYGHKWYLPGVHCPVCDASWSTGTDAYPSADLSVLPPQEQKKYSARLEEDYAEFERLREQVRPLVPSGVPLWPGTNLGPMVGSAQGEFGPLVLHHAWTLLMRREALERLQAEGVQGLKGCRTELRFRKNNPPELLEMELLPYGQLHPACLPVDRPVPCMKLPDHDHRHRAVRGCGAAVRLRAGHRLPRAADARRPVIARLKGGSRSRQEDAGSRL